MKRSYLPVGILALVITAINACSGEEGAAIEGTDASEAGSDAKANDSSTPEVTDATTAKDSGKDTAVKDSAGETSSEAAVVVPPTYAPVGSPCTMGSIETKECGLCGSSDRACLPGDGGSVWGDWGFCKREASGVDACDPTKTYTDGACGNCGTSKRVCQNDCTFAKGLACTEPKDSCQPGLSEFVLGLSCMGANQGRTRTCNAACTWDLSITCTTPPPNPNQIPISAVGTVKKKYQLDPAKQVKPPIAGTCPITLDAGSIAAFYVELKNTTAKTATVSTWYEEDIAASEFFFPYIAVYDGAIPPSASDPVALAACVGRVVDDCFAKECTAFYAGLVLGDYGAITIAPGKSVTLYVGGDVATKQPFSLNVRTESLK